MRVSANMWRSHTHTPTHTPCTPNCKIWARTADSLTKHWLLHAYNRDILFSSDHSTFNFDPLAHTSLIYITKCLVTNFFTLQKIQFVHLARGHIVGWRSGEFCCHSVMYVLQSMWLSSAAQRIVGRNSQKSMLACILQNATRCNRTSWYFGHTTY